MGAGLTVIPLHGQPERWRAFGQAAQAPERHTPAERRRALAGAAVVPGEPKVLDLSGRGPIIADGQHAAVINGSSGVEYAAARGAGASLIAPSALTLLMMLFCSNPKELMKAFAIYGAAACGKVSTNVVPLLTSLATEMAPPSCSTIFFEMARPRPSPRFLVVTKSSKIAPSRSGGIPQPVS